VNAVLFFSHYLFWHYTRAYRDIFATYLNFMWFIAYFFSLPLLIRTLFSPWKRIVAGHRKFDIEDWAEAVTFNILSRVTGFLIRSVLILIGFLMLAGLTILLGVFLVVWCLLPFIAVGSTYYGLVLLFV
jgi:hypothetical protein